MTKNKSTPRKTKNIVRRPATRFAHLQKRIRRGAKRGTTRPKSP